MKTLKIVAAAAVVTGLMATPVLAKDKHRMKVRHDTAAQMSDNTYRNDMRRQDSGFWPADVAAGAVGGAVGIAGAAVNTAGTIATAPFRAWDNSYAYYNGPDVSYDGRDAYARRNNFVCQPGTVFRGQDGRNHLCQ